MLRDAMGLFTKKKTCDWCGVRFKGAGVESGGLRFCGDECLALKEAPAEATAPTQARGVRRRRVGPRPFEAVLGDIDHARRTLGEYKAHVDHAKVVVTTHGLREHVEGADAAYLDAWQHLCDAAATMNAHGIETPRFDRLRDHGFGGFAVKKGVATNVRFFITGMAELMALVDAFQVEAGEAPIYDISPDEGEMTSLLQLCAAAEAKASREPDLMKLLDG